MNLFRNTLKKYDIKDDVLKRRQLTTVQVNMGDLCNQRCGHCHVAASPEGKKNISREVVDHILGFLSRNKVRTLDITGGAPELNPNFEYLVEKARPLVDELIVRSNLTVIFEKGREHLPEFYKKHQVHLICSLPCYTEDNVDKQRGRGVFHASIEALKILNQTGFARQSELPLDLVYNPLGAYLPGDQRGLEKDYKKALRAEHGIEFSRLLTITNVPIKNFRKQLEVKSEYHLYTGILKDNFNPGTLDNLMCRSYISVGYNGHLYDCDFNCVTGLVLRNDEGAPLTIGQARIEDIIGREILTDEHCLACTAGSGSSCQGALVETEDVTCTRVEPPDAKAVVKEYYGKILQGSKDLKTSACCSGESLPAEHKEILKTIEPEILEKFYGCGSPIPPALEGCTVLDLGCGTGRDSYLVSKMVGPKGRVIGVDMTDEQLAVARKHQDIQARKFGFTSTNAEFRKGYIEDLKDCGVEDNSVDVVISNCVINLSPDKRSVFVEIFRVLKNGGELYFSDVFSNARVPEAVRNDPILYGECLGGAMYIQDFRRLLRSLGCLDYRVMAQKEIKINDPLIKAKVRHIRFCSMTIRAFKLPQLEDICEDFGQVAYYLGTIPGHATDFALDDHHLFTKGKPMLVCGNSAAMVGATRFGKHFQVVGDTGVHYGAFPCRTSDSKATDGAIVGGCC